MRDTCEHEWEDAQLRTTKDGALIRSMDYCAKCSALMLEGFRLTWEAKSPYWEIVLPTMPILPSRGK